MKKSPADYLYVGLQLCLFVLYLWMPPKLDKGLDGVFNFIGALPLIIGMLILVGALIQLADVLSIFPSPKAGGKLVTTGLFGYMRHPIYAGLILMAFGYAIYTEDFNKLLVSIVLLVFFEVKASYEEQKLRIAYPDYASYSLRTGKFLPYFFRAEFKFDPAGDMPDPPESVESEGEQ